MTAKFPTFLTAFASLATALWSQGLMPEAITHPKPDSWPTFHGDYSGRHYSSLKEINAESVHNLTLGWVSRIDSSPGTNVGGPGPTPLGGNSNTRCAPLLVDGVLYVTRAQRRARHRRPHRPRDLEVQLERAARVRARQSRRRHLRQLALVRSVRRPLGFARH